MFRILVDTCVWLELAKDHQQQTTLIALEECVKRQSVALIVPTLVLDEFRRNKARVIEDAGRSLSSVVKRVKAAVDQFGDPKRKRVVIEQLNEVDHRIPTLGSNAIGVVARIEKLFKAGTVVEAGDALKLRAAQRAIEGKAPFHRGKNSINDAILIELFHDLATGASAGRTRYAFVTHNTKDFSHPSASTKLPHPDLAGYFSRIKARYFTNLAEALKRVDPDLISDVTIEHEWAEPPRSLKEIDDALDLLWHQVWYNRHQNLRIRIERSETQIVQEEAFPAKDPLNRPIGRAVWKLAQKAARRVERKYGADNLGPWDDFEWGMIMGKLSALRWVLGEEWDFLDT